MRNHFLVAAIALLAGCNGGSASITDGLAGTVLQLHTVYGYVDSSHLNANGVQVAASPASITIVASGASFDPTQDIRFMSADSLMQLDRDQANYGFLRILLPDITKLSAGTTVNLTVTDQDAAPNTVILDWGTSPLTNSSTVTAPAVLGSAVIGNFVFSRIPQKVGDTFAGTLTVFFSASSTDPPNAEAGTLTVKLSGLIVNEVLGSCNTQFGACVEPMGQGLPLNGDAGM